MSDHEDESTTFSGMNGLQAMGIVNALKTGDMWLDMIIAMMIPIVIQFILRCVGKIDEHLLSRWDILARWYEHRQNKHVRFIIHRSQRTTWGTTTNLDEDTRNTVLMKAIQLYLHHKCNLSLKTAFINLTSTEDKKDSYNSYNYGGYDSDDEGSNNNSKSLAGTLSSYKIIKKPPQNAWHIIGKFGKPAAIVKLHISENEISAGTDNKDAKSYSTTTFQLVSPGATSIDAFIDIAYQWYINELKKMDDHSRYLYDLKSTSSSTSDNDESDGGGKNSSTAYNRYKLSDEKTFNSLFFRQKDSLINIINHFQGKTGKYAVTGYPHKIGILLHGPPGTGKTSMIKALAQYTKRSIVNVPISRISTNSELMDVFFDQRYNVHGVDVPVKLGFKDVIFVMEDVDAASKVVRRRDDKMPSCGKGVAVPDNVELPPPKSTWKMLLESNNSDCQELVTKLMEKSDRLKTAAMESDSLSSLARRITTIPGIGLVGEDTGDDLLERVVKDAVGTVNSTMEDIDALDRFLGLHAQAINTMLENGIEVNDAFVDELLGFEAADETRYKSIAPLPHPTIRDISYSRYDEKMDEALFGHNNTFASKPANAAMSMTQEDFVLTDTDGKDSGGLKDVFGPSLLKPKKDQLNLTGLLNVLDGVVDTPGRILIMTTNHPEMLDPALIRPGRIDKKIMLGYMCPIDVIEMLEHYFQTKLQSGQQIRVERAIHDGYLKLTPAQIEQMTAECDEVNDIIQVLEEKAHLFSSQRTPATTPMSTSSTSISNEESNYKQL